MKMKNYELKIFDIDETLFETTAKIRVLKDGEVIRTLTNQEFNVYDLGDSEEFDFSEFKDSEKFFQESKPINKILNVVKDCLNDPMQIVKVVTARCDFDDKERFLETFRKHGIDIDRVHVYRAGNMDNSIPPATKKAIIIEDLLKALPVKKVSLFDDSIENLKSFMGLGEVFKSTEFDAQLAKSDGSLEKVF